MQKSGKTCKYAIPILYFCRNFSTRAIVENEQVVVEQEIKAAEGINDALELQAATEEHFGSKEKAKEIRSKVKPKTKETPAENNEDQSLNKDGKDKKPEAAKPIITQEGDDLKSKEVKATDKKDDKFFDPFAKESKPADGKEKKLDGNGKEIPDEKEKVVAAVEKSKEDLERDAIYPQLKEFHDKYKPLAENPLVIAILESGKDVITALRELQPMDYSLKSDDPTEQEGIERWRAKEYFSKIEGLKGADLTDSIDEYMAMEGVAKRRETTAQITALNNNQNERVQKFTQESAAAKAQRANNITKLTSDIQDFTTKIEKAGNFRGMQLADGKAKEFQSHMNDFFKRLFNPDGTVNTEVIANETFYTFYNKAVTEKKFEEAIKKTDSKAKQDVLEDVVQLDENNQSITNRKPKAEDNLEQLIDENFSAPKSK